MKIEEFLAREYPKTEKEQIGSRQLRSETTKVGWHGAGIEGHADLRDFPKLKKLIFHASNVTSIDVSNNPELEVIEVYNNSKLAGDLNTLSHLTKLTHLDLANTLFVGNLKSLEKCDKLKRLCITNTKIDGELQYLNLDGLEDFWCSDTVFQSMLEPYGKDFKLWKLLIYPNLIDSDETKILTIVNNKIEEIQKKLARITKAGCERYLCGTNYHSGRCIMYPEKNLKLQLSKLLEFKKEKEIK